jgi:hypothetical protein
MITREQFIESIRNEGRIMKHLYTKVPQDKLSYRPTPGQRSLEELLEFMPCNAAAITKHVISGDWSTFKEVSDKVKAAAKKDFAATVDQQIEEMITLVKNISEADLFGKEVTLPSGTKMPLGPALLEFPMKFMTAYRMQLFLYLKACGRTELTTPNLWRGTDPAPKK